MDPLSATFPGVRDNGSSALANTSVPPRFGCSAAADEFMPLMPATALATSKAEAATVVRAHLTPRGSRGSIFKLNFSSPNYRHLQDRIDVPTGRVWIPGQVRPWNY